MKLNNEDWLKLTADYIRIHANEKVLEDYNRRKLNSTLDVLTIAASFISLVTSIATLFIVILK